MSAIEIVVPRQHHQGPLLERLCAEQGRKLRWLEEAMGVSRHRLLRVRRGEVEMTLGEAVRAARALGVPLEALIEGVPDGTR